MAKKSIIKQLENMGATPTTKKSGILLAVSGDFNDGDYMPPLPQEKQVVQ